MAEDLEFKLRVARMERDHAQDYVKVLKMELKELRELIIFKKEPHPMKGVEGYYGEDGKP